MFTRLNVHNFRAVGPAPVELELRPLTVLVGENGCGKSSLLESLALTAQSGVEDSNRNELVLTGSRFEYEIDNALRGESRFREIYFSKDVSRPLAVGFEISVDEAVMRTIGWNEAAPPASLVEIVGQWPPRALSYRWTRRGVGDYSEWTHTVRIDESTLVSSAMKYTKVSRGGASAEGHFTLGKQTVGVLLRGERVLTDDLFRAGHLGTYAKDQRDLAEELERIGEAFKDALEGVLPLSPLRGYGLMHTDVGPDVEFVGLHAENTIRMLSSVQRKSRPEFRRLEAWAERFGLPTALPGWAGDNRLKIAFVDPISKARMELGDAASGSKQGLVLAAQLLLTKPGSTLLLEEPENNLHPKFEKLLPELFAESIASGHQILASTHSEVLVAALGNAVRKGLLRPDQVAIWHLTRDGEGIHPHEVRISDKGYLDGWIESFSKVEQELFDEWAQGLPEVGDEADRGHARAGKSVGGTKRKRSE